MSFYLPIGPIHPALKEPLNFIFKVEGELVIDAEPNIGFAHRGIEKLMENKTWMQNAFLAEHICGICSADHQGCYTQGAEIIYEKKPPERGLFIRTLVWELERIHSHLLWIGVAMHEAGFDTFFMYAWRDREVVLDLFEALCGRRVVYSMSTIGGVRRDLPPRFAEKIKKFVPYIKKRMKVYEDLALRDQTILARFQNVGILKKSDAIDLGAVGPTARGSGVKRDVRYEESYGAYEGSPYRIVVEDAGDSLAKLLVRIKEIVVSADILEYLVDNMPSGPINLNLPPMAKPPVNEAFSRVEAPRGELVYYLKSDGNLKPYRVKVRTPTLANITSVVAMVKGMYIADIPVVYASIDPCIGCMDRVLIIDTKKRKQKIMTKEELIHFSNKWFKRHLNELKEERA
ncbi:MAG: nickel-dependent hydrogenase large subunit [Candidatus Njordarchaeum guaymaensis]